LRHRAAVTGFVYNTTLVQVSETAGYFKMEHIGSLDDLDECFHHLNNEEEILQKEVEDLLMKCNSMSSPMLPDASLLKSVSRDLSQQLHSSLSSSHHTMDNLTKLKTVSDRANECITLLSDLLDLKSCTEGIQSCLDNEEYENASLIVQRFLKIDEKVVKEQSFLEDKTSIQEAFVLLESSTLQLQEMVLNKFDESVAADDVASVERFFKLFPFLNKQEEGLMRFASYLRSKIGKDMDTNQFSPSSLKEEDYCSLTNHTEHLSKLLQTIALTIDVHQPLIETYYKHGNLLKVIKGLQEECDERGKLVFKDYSKVVKAVKAKVMQKKDDHQVNHSSLETLLTQIILLIKRCKTYFDFIRKRVSQDYSTAFATQSEEFKTASANLMSLIHSCKLFLWMQDLNGDYVSLQQYVLRESITSVIKAVEESEDMTVDHHVSDDVFFILKKCLLRSCTARDVQVLVPVIYECLALLDKEYYGFVSNKTKFGLPTNLFSKVAYNALSGGQSLDIFFSGVNEADESSRRITSLKDLVTQEFKDGEGTKDEKKLLEAALQDMTGLTVKFQSLAKKSLHDIFKSVLKDRIKTWKSELNLQDHNLTELSNEINRDFTSSFIRDLDLTLKQLKSRLTDTNYNNLVLITITETVERIEVAIKDNDYNKVCESSIESLIVTNLFVSLL
jgi:hypothetical protein